MQIIFFRFLFSPPFLDVFLSFLISPFVNLTFTEKKSIVFALKLLSVCMYMYMCMYCDCTCKHPKSKMLFWSVVPYFVDITMLGLTSYARTYLVDVVHTQ